MRLGFGSDLVVDVNWQDVEWQSNKHPRGKKGSSHGGQFVSKGKEGGIGALSRPTSEWKAPETSEHWAGLSQSGLWKKSRLVGSDPSVHDTKDLNEALKHLRPGGLNKIDRDHRKRIVAELARRLVRARPVVPVKVEPPPVQPARVEPVKPGSWQPPAESTVWDAPLRERIVMAKRVGAAPHGFSDVWLKEALLHLRPLAVSKQDRPLRIAIAKELALRATGKRTEPVKQEPVKPVPVSLTSVHPEASQSNTGEPRSPTTNKTVAEVVATRSEAEKKWHGDSWEHAEPRIIDVIANTRPVYIQREAGKISHYSPMLHHINMNENNSNREVAGAVFRHEFGHAVDYNGAGVPSSYKYMDLVNEEWPLIVHKRRLGENRDLGVDSDKFDEERPYGVSVRDIDSYLKDTEDNSMPRASRARWMTAIKEGTTGVLYNAHIISADRLMYNDFLGAMTRNIVGYGHSNAYYAKRPTRRTSESFANYVALTNGKHGKVYRALLHSIAPKTCAGFDQILNDRAKGIN